MRTQTTKKELTVEEKLDLIIKTQARLVDGLLMVYRMAERIEQQLAAAPSAPAATGVITETVTGPLVVSVLDGKTYYAVKVPSWAKHGVRVWPELLATAGVDEAAIDIRNPLDLTGWQCQYILKDDGNPLKAVGLTRPGN